MSQYEPTAPPQKASKKAKKMSAGKLIGGAAVAAVATGALNYLTRRTGVIVPDFALTDPPAVEPGQQTRQSLARLVTQSHTALSAADLLTTTAAEIERLIRNRSLYAFQSDRTWHLPKFQFHRRHVVAGIEQVVPKLDRNLHPIEVVNWFTLTNPDLVIDEGSVSPIKWLELGGDANRVAELAVQLGSGI